MIDGTPYSRPVEKNLEVLGKGEEFILFENPLFKKSWTYGGFASLPDCSKIIIRREVPLIARGLRKLFGEEKGNYLGQYVSYRIFSETDFENQGARVRRRFPFFLELKFD